MSAMIRQIFNDFINWIFFQQKLKFFSNKLFFSGQLISCYVRMSPHIKVFYTCHEWVFFQEIQFNLSILPPF